MLLPLAPILSLLVTASAVFVNSSPPSTPSSDKSTPDVVSSAPRSTPSSDKATSDVVSSPPPSTPSSDKATSDVVSSSPQPTPSFERSTPDVVSSAPRSTPSSDKSTPDVVSSAPRSTPSSDKSTPDVVSSAPKSIPSPDKSTPDVVSSAPRSTPSSDKSTPDVVSLSPQSTSSDKSTPDVVSSAPRSTPSSDRSTPDVVSSAPRSTPSSDNFTLDVVYSSPQPTRVADKTTPDVVSSPPQSTSSSDKSTPDVANSTPRYTLTADNSLLDVAHSTPEVVVSSPPSSNKSPLEMARSLLNSAVSSSPRPSLSSDNSSLDVAHLLRAGVMNSTAPSSLSSDNSRLDMDGPGDITVHAVTKMLRSASYDDDDDDDDDKPKNRVEVINEGTHRIGWTFDTNNQKLEGLVDPPNGVLDPKETVLLAVNCDVWRFNRTGTDRIVILWTNTPEGAGKKFRREWLWGDKVVRHKNLSVECNVDEAEPDDITVRAVRSPPYDDKQKDRVEVINEGSHRIGWTIRPTQDMGFVNPSSGVLDPKESVLLVVSCDAFLHGSKDLVIWWTNTPEGAGKQVRREWFWRWFVRRKNLPIVCNVDEAEPVFPGNILLHAMRSPPYDDMQKDRVKVINDGSHRIGWTIRINSEQLQGSINPSSGVLDPDDSVVLKVSCLAWRFRWWTATGKDPVVILWTNTPEGAGKHFRREWLLGDNVVRRKKLPFACRRQPLPP